MTAPHPVVCESTPARQLAAAHGVLESRARLPQLIIGLLDQVWPVLRQQQVRTGHNVVVYVGGSPVKVVAGVEVLSPLEPTDTVQPFSTPAGEVVTTVHWGEYSQMHGAYTALEAWCAANRRQPSGISWEVYGDAADEPADRRTDIYLLLR